MKVQWGRLGGQLGVGFCVLGFLLIFLGWNGAASHIRVDSQFPYLISGGIAGLCLVVIGVGMIVVQSQRADRALLQSAIDELRRTLEGSGAPSAVAQAEVTTEMDGLVVAGPTTYHRPGCRLLEGRGGLPTMTPHEAEGRGLSPCRTCDAAGAGLPEASPRRRRARAG